MSTLELCNSIRKDIEGIDTRVFPMDVFPQAVQKIILDVVKYDGLNIELLTTSMLAATSTAIGNAFVIHIRGNWYTNCALFFILAARPGTGKTPALSFAFAPIRERDMELQNRFTLEMAKYKRDHSEKSKGCDDEKPHSVRIVLDDFTPETLYRQHYYNQRGVVVLVDEILGLMKSRKRYNGDSKLIEDLMSAFSGSPINYMRKDEEVSYCIPRPCINLIGGIQTNLVQELFTDEFTSNGFTDRLTFVTPSIQEIPKWTVSEENSSSVTSLTKWCEIIRKIMGMQCEYIENSETIKPKVLEMSQDAREFLTEWNNSIVERINSIKDDNLIDTHQMKLNGILPRFALILQVLRWAVGEAELECIDKTSILGAKKLIDYFEGKYYQLKNIARLNETQDIENEWFSSLPDKFSTSQAQTEWTRVGLKRRELFRHLTELCTMSPPVISKVSHGVYVKASSNAPPSGEGS